MARAGTSLLGEFWHECARSGFTYPESEMVLVEGKWIAIEHLDENEFDEEEE